MFFVFMSQPLFPGESGVDQLVEIRATISFLSSSNSVMSNPLNGSKDKK